MRYIITNKQSNLLRESDHLLWVKRRINKDILRDYVDEAMLNYPTLCDDFKYDYEYMDEIINDAVMDFLTTHEEMFLDDTYDEVNQMITDICQKWFGNWLLEVYKMTCN